MPAASLPGNPDPSANEETRKGKAPVTAAPAASAKFNPPNQPAFHENRAEDDRIQVGAGRPAAQSAQQQKPAKGFSSMTR